MKLAAFQKILKQKDLDGALFIQSSLDHKEFGFSYFTGLDDFENAGLFIPRSGKPRLFGYGFEYDRMKKSTKFPVEKVKGSFWDTVIKHVKKKDRIGINGRNLPVKMFTTMKQELQCTLVDIGKDLLELRFTKTADELRLMQKACKIGDNIIQDCFSNFKSFTTEKGVETFLRKACIDADVEPSFDPIVASGPNGAIPHHIPKDRLRKGFCVIDFGVKYKGYCSDMTRMVYLGNPTKPHLNIYNKLLEVQKECVKQVKSKKKFWDIDTFARKQLGKEEPYFIHGLGHSLGMEVHDPVPARKNMVLQKGTVITIEPGLYYPGKFGMRIEDDVVVGGKVLTKTPKSLYVVK